MRAITAIMAAAAALFLTAAQSIAQLPQAKSVLTDPGPTGVRVDQAGVFGNWFPAQGAGKGGKRPAILLLGGSEGGLGAGAARMALALQAHGFDVLQAAYFGAPGTPDALVAAPLETFDHALAWLKAKDGVDPARIGIVGGSKGAEAALLVAARDPSIKAVAVGMPSSVAWSGISYTAEVKSTWTADGKPVPFLPYAFGPDTRSIYGAYANGLMALDRHADAIIPVERINGPVLMVCGKADTLWPSCSMAEQIAARLRAKGFRPNVEVLEYPDAGHAVFGPPLDAGDPRLPTLAALGGTAAGNNAARADDWPKTLAFLDAALTR